MSVKWDDVCVYEENGTKAYDGEVGGLSPWVISAPAGEPESWDWGVWIDLGDTKVPLLPQVGGDSRCDGPSHGKALAEEACAKILAMSVPELIAMIRKAE